MLSGWEPRSELVDRVTYLIRESASSEITKRKLESSIATLNIDLQGDESVRVGR